MTWVVEPLARAATRHPVWLIAALAAITVVMGGLASQQETATDIAEFSPDTELARGFDRIEEEFGARGGAVQVVVDAGKGGDVLDREGLIAAERIETLIRDTPAVAGRLAEGSQTAPAIRTWADPVLGRVEALELEADELTDVFADAVVAGALSGQGAERVSGLVSNDFDRDAGRARAGLVFVQLDPDLGFEERLQAARALDDALADADFGSLSAEPFSFELINDDIQAGFESELPLLLLISLALMVVILAALYRRVSDVAVGLAGLLITVVWMTGLSVLLGPNYLGLTGEFNQIAIAVPVLLVGLGIDYSVHLTTRYRESRLDGHSPASGAGMAVRTVGVALTLATLTTVFGFLSNFVAPLPPIRDFGVFAAVGVASAFVVLGGLVPAVRVLLDRRRPDRLAPPVADRTGTEPAIRAIARLARRAPAVVIAVAVLLAGAGAAAATALDTEFSQEEFIPEDSDASRMLTTLDERFGGDVSEETFLLVDADFTQRETWRALATVERGLADVDGVVTTNGRAETVSPVGLLVRRTQAAAAAAARIQQELAAALGVGDAADRQSLLVLPDHLSPADVPEPLRERLAGADGAADSPAPGELDEQVRALAAGGNAARLSGIAPQRAGPLLERNPATITLEDLAAAGYPVDSLDPATRRQLADAAALRAAGWDGRELAADADIAAIRDILAGDDGGLDGVLADDAQSGLVRLSTRAGDEGAARLAADITERLGPLEAAGADVLVASEPLLIDQTLDQLSDAQTRAIIVSLTAALALLVAYYAITRRRPLLGVITMLPALLAVPLVLGSMWALGLSFNAMTATIASIAIGIGVPYGIHVTNRFVEEIGHGDVDRAITTTLTNTGAALVGSAVTTGAAFAVLMLSTFPPIGQFGGITALTIAYALLAAAIVESAALVWWGRREIRRHPPPGADPRRGAPLDRRAWAP